MNLQLSRLSELTSALQLPGIDANACDLAQQAAKEDLKNFYKNSCTFQLLNQNKKTLIHKFKL